MDTINQVFALFRLNFHNQFYSAYSDTELLNQTKRLWLDALAHCSVEQVLQGAKRVIESSEYLPTLHRMLECCEEFSIGNGIPAPKQAYLEACNAPSPKAHHNWSHPMVYHAGLATGWHLLNTEAEKVSYPVFLRHYRELSRQAQQGNTFALPSAAVGNAAVGSPEARPNPAADSIAQEHLAKLKAEFNLP